MIKRVILSLFVLATSVLAAETVTVTNKTSPVTVKGWKRTYVYGLSDGRLIDPSGKIASYAAGAAEGATTKKLADIADEARIAANEQLDRLYSKTNLISTFTKKIFVQAVLYPDLTMLSNCWGRVVGEWTDGTNDHAWVYFSREFKVPPVMKRRYRSELATNYVEGVWKDFSAPGQLIDGYAGCKEISFVRPDFARNVNCFPSVYLRFGTREAGFDFGTRVFTIDNELYYTGAWTNAQGKIWWWNNGVKTRGEADVN